MKIIQFSYEIEDIDFMREDISVVSSKKCLVKRHIMLSGTACAKMLLTKKPTAETVGFFNVFLVKVMGIEHMSESISTEASPSAACILRFRL